MFDKQSYKKNEYMLNGSFARKGYDWWWHSFTAINRKTKEEKPFFVEFFICNPKLAKDTPTLGQSEENKGKNRPSYYMLKCGAWGENKSQLHRYFSIKDVEINKCPIEIKADDCYLSETRIQGSVNLSKEEVEAHKEYMCDSGSMSFDIKINKMVAFNVGYGSSGFFRFIKAFEMYWHAQGMKSQYEGTITYNGEVFDVIPDKSYGYADKNWGRGFTTPWVWLSSNNLYSNISKKYLTNSVFDIGGGKPKVFFVSLDRKLLSAFLYEGKEYEFNFSKFWTHTKTMFDFKEDNEKVYWTVIQTNRDSKMETHISCLKKDMLFINYEAPDGSKRHNRLFNGGNGVGNVKLYKKVKRNQYELIDDIDCYNVGCEYGEYDK